MNIYRSFIHNCPKLETTQISLIKDRYTVVHTCIDWFFAFDNLTLLPDIYERM